MDARPSYAQASLKRAWQLMSLLVKTFPPRYSAMAPRYFTVGNGYSVTVFNSKMAAELNPDLPARQHRLPAVRRGLLLPRHARRVRRRQGEGRHHPARAGLC